MIVFSDVHLREDSEEIVLNEVLPGILDAAKQEGKRYGKYEITCLGDFFHFRYRVEVRLQNLVYDVFKEWSDNGVHLRMLPGNHDQYDAAGRNALELYGEIPLVDVFTEARTDGAGLWIPYRKNPAYISWAVQKFYGDALNSKGKRVCFLHNGLTGALMNDRFVNELEGVPVESFTGFDTVLCGHYHKRQTLEHAHYIGSPYQTRADESGQPKGFAIWDGERLEYVDTHWGKRYHRITLEPGSEFELKGIDPRDDVRISTAAGVDPGLVSDQLVKAGIENHTVTPDVESIQARLDVPANANLRTYAQAYIAAQDTDALGLDPSKLMSLFDAIAGEVRD